MDNITSERKQVKRKKASESVECEKQPLSEKSDMDVKTKRRMAHKKMKNLYMGGDDSFELPSGGEDPDSDYLISDEMIKKDSYIVREKKKSISILNRDALQILANAIFSPVSYKDDELKDILIKNGYYYSVGSIRHTLLDGTMERNGFYPLLVKKATNKKSNAYKDGTSFSTIEMLVNYMDCGYKPVFIDECLWYTGWKWRHCSYNREGTLKQKSYLITSLSAMGPSGGKKIITPKDVTLDIECIDEFVRELVEEVDGNVIFFMESVPNRMEYTIKRIIEYYEGKKVVFLSPYSRDNVVYRKFLIEWRNRVKKNYKKTPSKTDLTGLVHKEFLGFNADYYNELIDDIRNRYNNIVLSNTS